MVIRKQRQKNVRILEQYYIIQYTADVSTVFFFSFFLNRAPSSLFQNLAFWQPSAVKRLPKEKKKCHIGWRTLPFALLAVVCLII